MNVDDIVGLTADQIQDKFSIPGHYPPTHICDVTVPKGAILEISSANGILGHSGGGVQYMFISDPNPSWFTNSSAIE